MKYNSSPYEFKQQMAASSPYSEDTRTIITKQFLSQLRQQISLRIKPSKSVLQALRHSSTLNKDYHKEIAQLKQKLSKAYHQNQLLREKIKKLQLITENPNLMTIPLINVFQPKVLEQANSVLEQVRQNQNKSDSIEVHLLQQKLKHLQQYKTLKEVRFSQMIDRQSKFVGEIDMLKYKNQILESQNRSLETALQKLREKYSFQSQSYDQKNWKRSQASQKFREYINQSDGKENLFASTRQAQTDELNIPNHSNLINSSTKLVDIVQEYNLQNLSRKHASQKVESQNQIDLMIEEELPYITNEQSQSDDRKVTFNINSSLVVVSLDFNVTTSQQENCKQQSLVLS